MTAKTHLSRLLDEAAAGEEIVIAKAGKPVARLVAMEVPRMPRSLGVLAGKIVESPNCWEPDEDLSESIDSPLLSEFSAMFVSKVAEEPTPYRL